MCPIPRVLHSYCIMIYRPLVYPCVSYYSLPLERNFVFFIWMDKYEALSPVFLCVRLDSVIHRSQFQNVRVATSVCTIAAGSQFVYPVLVPLPNTVLSWTFSSSNYDIEFSVVKMVQDKDSEVILETDTYSPDTRYQGEVVIPKCGSYQLVWDNSKSWLREKTVAFSISLKVPTPLSENQTLCSSTILKDLHQLAYESRELEQTIEEREGELEALKVLAKQRQDKKESIDVEIMSMEATLTKLKEAVTSKKRLIEKEENRMEQCHAMAAFLIEDERIFSMLDSADMLKLAQVNRYLRDATHQDTVWKRLFACDSKEHLAVALRNEWLLQKWRLFSPNAPIPQLDSSLC